MLALLVRLARRLVASNAWRTGRTLRTIWNKLEPVRRWLPKSAIARGAERQLRRDVDALSPLPVRDLDRWAEARSELRKNILTKDARWFREWKIIRETMDVNRSRFVQVEAHELAETHWFTRLDGRDGNVVHMAYHLMHFEQCTGHRIADFRSVIEFGGGFGMMAEVVKQAGMRGPYHIIDLPELSALQKYYHCVRGVTGVSYGLNAEAFDGLASLQAPTLAIATWSLSEAPVQVREEFLGAISSRTDAFIFAYQDRFSEIDNVRYFAHIQESLPHVSWIQKSIPHLPGNHYLFGSRSSRAAR